ncbi:MAG: hypothetical protein D3905_03990 [Candidatus Electrothrix sp. AS4_5]|nr:hypothetical protein [Candidatus Electrothrix gigas]MCI5188957.1 hypothetical protein [Candidatus Electrothrix gigas]
MSTAKKPEIFFHVKEHKIMTDSILAIFEKNPVVFSIATILILIGFFIKTVRDYVGFHEEVLVKRYINRLSFLSSEVDTNSITYRYLDALKENEAFLVASGINTYPEKAKMLMEIYLLGVASKNELKRLLPFLTPDNDKVSIRVDFIDQAAFFYSFISTLAFFSFGFYSLFDGAAVSTLVTGRFDQLIVGVVIMFICTLIGLFTGKEHITRRSLIRVSKELIKRDMITNPEKKIDWNITLNGSVSFSVSGICKILNC